MTQADAEVTQPSKTAAEHATSKVFDELVADDHDLPGLVAYGLYKQRKRNWHKDFVAQFGRAPNEEDIGNFRFSYRSDALQAIKSEAEGILVAFSESMSEQQIPDLMKEAFNSRTLTEIEQLKASISKISGYRHHIVGHVLGFFALVLLATVVTLAIKYEPHLAGFINNIDATKLDTHQSSSG